MSNEIQKSTQSNSSLERSSGQNKLIGDWIRNEAEYSVARTYEGKRIEDFTHEDMKKLVEIMALWRHHLGVTSDPTEQELIVICQFVYDNFKRMTLADIRLAMNWAISGKVEVGFVTQKNISSYYVSKAINAYAEAKRHIYNDMMENRERVMMQRGLEKKVQHTPVEKANQFREYIVSLYQAHSQGGYFYDICDFAYAWLKKTNQLKLSKEDINAAVEYGKKAYTKIKQADAGSAAALLRQSIAKETREQAEKRLAREFILIRYFESTPLSQIIDRINIRDFIDD